jgi:protein-S-isoprenylcysteine O-methyltransferase Ste14
MRKESKIDKPTLKKFLLNMLPGTFLFPALILFLGGDLRWLEGWLFAAWFDLMLVFNAAYLYFKDPALLAERQKAPGSDNQQPWDKYLLTGIYVIACLWLVVMPLDARRFSWSPVFPLWLKVLGGILLLPALYFIERTTMQNTYLSTLVRIQSERKQYVISTGVYGFVRHPLYFGCMLMMIGGPLLLGSLYGLLLTALGMLAIVVRILGEEKLLAEELEGYAEYRQKVTYRLIPFIW